MLFLLFLINYLATSITILENFEIIGYILQTKLDSVHSLKNSSKFLPLNGRNFLTSPFASVLVLVSLQNAYSDDNRKTNKISRIIFPCINQSFAINICTQGFKNKNVELLLN